MDIPVCAGILAGGKSSRMGRDKALLPCEQGCFLEKLVSVCGCFPEVLVSAARPEDYGFLPVPVVADQLEGFGPVEGIYQLLRAAKSPYVLAVATDMQRLEAEFLRRLAGCLRGDEDCLALRMEGRVEPLCSIYGKGALPALEALRREGCHRPRAAFERVNTRYVDGETLGCDRRLMSNINTPEEYDALKQGAKDCEGM